VKNVPNEDLSPKTADADAPGKWSMLAVGSLLQLSRASGLRYFSSRVCACACACACDARSYSESVYPLPHSQSLYLIALRKIHVRYSGETPASVSGKAFPAAVVKRKLLGPSAFLFSFPTSPRRMVRRGDRTKPRIDSASLDCVSSALCPLFNLCHIWVRFPLSCTGMTIGLLAVFRFHIEI